MPVDLSPIFEALIGVCAVALTTFGSWALGRLAQKIGVQTNNEAIRAFDEALAKSIQAGASALQGLIHQRGYDSPEVKSAIVAWAVPYAVSKFSPALRSIGLDPNNAAATGAYLRAELDRIFPLAMTPIGASPVTPPLQPSPPGTTANDLNRLEAERLNQERAGE